MPNARNRLAASTRRPRAFPVEVVIPPHRGASVCAIEMPLPVAKVATLAPPVKKPKAAKPASTKRKKKKVPQRRRKAVVKPSAGQSSGPPVIALPQRSEPLTEPAIDLAAWSALAPSQPNPAPTQSRALAPYRSGGLLVAVADWLGSRTQQLWRKLGGTESPAPQHRARLGLVLRRVAPPEGELLRLRAENERLRLQLEALLALQTGAGGSQAASPA